MGGDETALTFYRCFVVTLMEISEMQMERMGKTAVEVYPNFAIEGAAHGKEATTLHAICAHQIGKNGRSCTRKGLSRCDRIESEGEDLRSMSLEGCAISAP